MKDFKVYLTLGEVVNYNKNLKTRMTYRKQEPFNKTDFDGSSNEIEIFFFLVNIWKDINGFRSSGEIGKVARTIWAGSQPLRATQPSFLLLWFYLCRDLYIRIS